MVPSRSKLMTLPGKGASMECDAEVDKRNMKRFGFDGPAENGQRSAMPRTRIAIASGMETAKCHENSI